ncbi:MAG TPA: redox-sensing transcriptional repressor Rex [Armatimonadota bacterium]|nr:redox-sensing transcriptional repressor Rex [Armatimonadota bacterium]
MAITISAASLRRLPQYLKVLSHLADDNKLYVTSAELARQLKLDETLVRKDISVTGFTGKPRVGFPVQDLLSHLEVFLGLRNTKEAFIIGAGRLGQALAAYQGFEKYGLRIVALFDTEADKIGQVVAGKEVLPLWKAPALARRMNVRIAILTVPQQAAQAVADLLVDSGMMAFWNFSGKQLQLPDHIIVHSEDLAESLAVLSHRLAQEMEHIHPLLVPTPAETP